MTDKKNLKAIIHYKDFLRLNNATDFLENEFVEFLIYIKKDEYKKLSEYEKKKLYGFRRTTMEPLKKPIINKEELFLCKDFPPMPEIKIIEQSFKEKHKKYSKPYCPKNLVNKNYNTRKKGGR